MELSAEQLYWLLPDSVHEIAAVIGWEHTLQLVVTLGGVELAIPTGEQDSDRKQLLIDAIGKQATTTLMRYYGGAKLYIPRCQKFLRTQRNARFRAAVDMAMMDGTSQTLAIQQLAPQFGISQRWGHHILMQSTDKQMSLFDDIDTNNEYGEK